MSSKSSQLFIILSSVLKKVQGLVKSDDLFNSEIEELSKLSLESNLNRTHSARKREGVYVTNISSILDAEIELPEIHLFDGETEMGIIYVDRLKKILFTKINDHEIILEECKSLPTSYVGLRNKFIKIARKVSLNGGDLLKFYNVNPMEIEEMKKDVLSSEIQIEAKPKSKMKSKSKKTQQTKNDGK